MLKLRILTGILGGLFLLSVAVARAPIGDWNRSAVLDEDINNRMDSYSRLALATGVIYRHGFLSKSLGTTFYLGRFKNQHVMATNKHVIDDLGCATVKLRLPGRGWVRFACERILGRWSDIDLALFTIGVQKENESYFFKIAQNFDFDSRILQGAELMNVGFGYFNNPKNKQTVSRDSECRVVSRDDEFRIVTGTGTNKSSLDVITFAHGCDSSSGDSGSAIVDRNTGQILGIHSLGGDSNGGPVSRKDMHRYLESGEEELWRRMNFAVPASAIKTRLERHLEGAQGADAEVIRELLQVP